MPSLNQVRLVSHRDELDRRVQQAVRAKLTAMGMEVRTKLLTEVLVGSRSGRTYRVPGTGRTYQASRPGEAPATRLGALRQSYAVGPVEGQGLALSIKVGSPLNYAAVLETARDRPHLKPAVQLAQPAFPLILGGDWGI